MENEMLQHIIRSALQLNRDGLNQGRSGNISVRDGDGLRITASGASFDALTPEDLIWSDLAGHYSGTRGPSSELSFHAGIYRQHPEVAAIVHLHSPWATSLACMHHSIPAFHYMVAVAGGDDIPCVPYATSGSEELARLVVDALQWRSACLLANHGQIATGPTLEKAVELAVEVENLARCYGQILSMGQPELLNREQMAEVLERFHHYGARLDSSE